MKFYDKYSHPFAPNAEMPRVSMQIAEAQCFHCGKTTRFPVKPEYIDWQRIAESYGLQLKQLMADFDQMNRDVEVLHGDNPAAQYVCNRLAAAIQGVMDRMNDDKRESGT